MYVEVLLEDEVMMLVSDGPAAFSGTSFLCFFVFSLLLMLRRRKKGVKNKTEGFGVQTLFLTWMQPKRETDGQHPGWRKEA